MYDANTILAVALIFALSSAIQCAVGFAFALFSMPLLLWLGVPLPCAIALVCGGSLVQCGVAAWQLREHVDWRECGKASLVRTLFTPVGVGLMALLIHALTVAQVKQIVGVILGSILLVQWRVKPAPQPSLGWRWGMLAYTSSGILGGLCGMAGPPLVLYSHAHDWGPHRIRAYMYANVLLVTAPTLLFLCIATGTAGDPSMWDVLVSFGVGFATFPAIVLGSWPGMWVGHRMSKPRLKQAAFAILGVLAISSILAPYLSRPDTAPGLPVQAASLPPEAGASR